MRESTEKIRRYILDKVTEHSHNIAAITSKEFGISRQAVLKHIKALIDSKKIRILGEKNQRFYFLQEESYKFSYSLPGIDESDIFIKDILPHISNLGKNTKEIAQYCFTEMVNNANDHSGGDRLGIGLFITAQRIGFVIKDNGVGIFRKIAKAMNLPDESYAILELAKGKFTTDKTKHSGEGIFFSSKASDFFSILSGKHKFIHFDKLPHPDKLTEDEPNGGTTVVFFIDIKAEKALSDIFWRYMDDEYGFTKTAFEVSLLRVGEENLVSRSQAKRLLARLDKFKTVVLDFKNVDTIGQAFADEIFRVFANEYPQVRIETANTSKDVEMMIKRAIARKEEI